MILKRWMCISCCHLLFLNWSMSKLTSCLILGLRKCRSSSGCEGEYRNYVLLLPLRTSIIFMIILCFEMFLLPNWFELSFFISQTHFRCWADTHREWPPCWTVWIRNILTLAEGSVGLHGSKRNEDCVWRGRSLYFQPSDKLCCLWRLNMFQIQTQLSFT